MHFSHINDGSGSKATKIALVTGLHVLLGVGLVKTLDTKTISMPELMQDITVMLPEPVKPPPAPPEPPKPMPKAAPPEVVVPKVEVDITPPPVEQQVQATTEADPQPTPSETSVQTETPPAQSSSSNSGEMRTAVLADANGCAKPDYPANAARNGETGTVTLALLVGADGRVSSSRVQKSSGSRELDRAAVNALSLCKFKPAMNGGAAEAGWAQIAYVWSLDE